ncbi:MULTISPECIES: glycosyltransferase [Cyanophyceae]|uniref:glycosyltransferase n=1 Tax=Cyanophyceae TaxID=3028117 RepID=UPI001689149E|nr:MULTISPECIES: glycosyltransferase [Cyanophyceae]MBD1915165.1 glycosyltransferase [Phormidium sp. FACHB-77]MBD2028447.1 glycosyltransferase [Phormidium sp. FACHB-322]MBD2051847.1 glycosyltransferase [Leptolyngbya sp. FACHB-60]
MTASLKTLAFLVTAFPPEVSGSAHFNWARAQWFAEQGYRVIVFAPDWQNGTETAPVSENLIIERYPSQPWIPYKLTYVPTVQAARAISQQIERYQPDLIVMTDVERYFLLSAWQLPGRRYARDNQVPYLAEYHTDVYNFSSTYPGWQWLRSVVRQLKLLSHLYHQLDATICPSKAASQSCQEMGIKNTHIIPFFGTDISTYNPERRNRKWLEPWLTPQAQDHKTIVFLGRLGFEKRVDLLIEAFAQLKRRRSNCSLLIVGDGPADVVASLKKVAEPVADIHFTGFLMGETKANVLASCDLFCSPSPYETFGLTVVEAMASGVPVVTVRSGAVAEYLIDQKNAYLVTPNDTVELGDRLELALNRDNTALIQQALQDASHYSVEHGCQNLHEYYQQLLRPNSADQVLVSTPNSLPSRVG